MNELMLVILPVVLFAITLAIIFFLRMDDKRNNNLKRVMDRIGQFRTEVDKVNSQLKENSQQASNEVNARVDDVNQLIRSIDDKVSDLEGRSDDLSKLQVVMNNYRKVLEELSSTTMQAELKIREVNDNVVKMNQVKDTIADFRNQIEVAKQTIQANLEVSLSSVKTMEDSTRQHLDSYNESVKKTMEDTQARIDAYTLTLRNHQEMALSTVSQQTDLLRQLEKQVGISLDSYRTQFNQLQRDLVGKMNEDLVSFSTDSAQRLNAMFRQTIEQMDSSFLSMVHTAQAFINELDNRLSSTKEVSSLLDSKNTMLLSELSQKLGDYSQQLSNSQALNDIQDNRKKQIAQSLSEMQREADNLHKELDELKGEKSVLLQNVAAKIELTQLEDLPFEMAEKKNQDISSPCSCSESEREPAVIEETPVEQVSLPEKNEPVLEDALTYERDGGRTEGGSLSDPQIDVDSSQPLITTEPKADMERKETGDGTGPSPSELEKEIHQSKSKVSYVPIGKEEIISLDDDENP
ncbi:MAG: hypothetical protein WCR02_00215 [Sphaerochaetaceae bacterium]